METYYSKEVKTDNVAVHRVELQRDLRRRKRAFVLALSQTKPTDDGSKKFIRLTIKMGMEEAERVIYAVEEAMQEYRQGGHALDDTENVDRVIADFIRLTDTEREAFNVRHRDVKFLSGEAS